MAIWTYEVAKSVAQPINVGFVVNNLDVGGLEKVVVSLLDNLDRDKFTPHLICLDGAGKMAAIVDLPAENRLVLQRKDGVRVPFLGVRVDASRLYRIRRFVKARHIAVLHAHNIGPLIYAGFATRLIPMRRRPQIVYSDHNQLFSMTPSRARARALVPETGRRGRRGIRRPQTHADRIPPRAGWPGARPLQRRGQAKVRAGRSVQGPARAWDRRRRVRRGSAVVLSEHKGFGYLLDAAKAVLAQAPATRFVIAGDGPVRAGLGEKARALGFGDRVMFIGYRTDIPDVVSAFDTYVLPS